MDCGASACTFSVATEVCCFSIMVWISWMGYCFFFSWKRKEIILGDLAMFSQSNGDFCSIIKPVDGVLSDNSISVIERIICLTYDKTTFISNVNDCFPKKVKLSITCRQLKMLWFNTLNRKNTRVDKIVTNMLWYIFCTISLIVVFIFQTKCQTLYTHRLYLYS